MMTAGMIIAQVLLSSKQGSTRFNCTAQDEHRAVLWQTVQAACKAASPAACCTCLTDVFIRNCGGNVNAGSE